MEEKLRFEFYYVSDRDIPVKEIAGVYQIKNKLNGDTYVGSTNDLQGRESEHFRPLRRGRHFNNYLQNAWDRYGEDNFEYSVLEFCYKFSLPSLRIVEQRYIDNLNPKYNIVRDATLSFPVRRSSKKILKLVILKPDGEEIICNDVGRFCRENGIDIGNLLKCAKGKIFHHRGFRCRYIDSPDYLFFSSKEKGIKSRVEKNSKEFIVQFPDGHEEKIKNLAEFARQNDLEVSSLRHMALGEHGNSQGFKVRYAHETEFRFKPKPREFSAKKYKIIEPNGNVTYIKNFKKFCKIHKLDYGSFRKASLKNKRIYKGYFAEEIPK